MRCDKCKVEIRGAPDKCPLCQGNLSGKASEADGVFPQIEYIVRPHIKFIRLLVFLTIAAAILCFAINYSLEFETWWSVFVAAGILCFWLSFAVVIHKKRNIPKTIIYQVILLSALAFLLDWYTGSYGWSLDFVIPIACSSAMLLSALVARILRLTPSDYMVYLVLDIILGITSLILLLCGLVNVILPSVMCVACSVISLAALISFEGKSLKNEIKKWFHI